MWFQKWLDHFYRTARYRTLPLAIFNWRRILLNLCDWNCDIRIELQYSLYLWGAFSHKNLTSVVMDDTYRLQTEQGKQFVEPSANAPVERCFQKLPQTSNLREALQDNSICDGKSTNNSAVTIKNNKQAPKWKPHGCNERRHRVYVPERTGITCFSDLKNRSSPRFVSLLQHFSLYSSPSEEIDVSWSQHPFHLQLFCIVPDFFLKKKLSHLNVLLQDYRLFINL